MRGQRKRDTRVDTKVVTLRKLTKLPPCINLVRKKMHFCLNNMVWFQVCRNNPSHLHSFGGLKGDGCYGKIQHFFSLQISLFQNSDMGKDGLHGVVDSFLIII